MPPQTLDHSAYDVITPDANATFQQLHRQMTVAKVPGNAHEVTCSMGMNLQQLFGPRADPDDASLRQQSITVSKPDRLRQVDQDLFTHRRSENDATSIAAVMINQDMVDLSIRIPAPCWKNFDRVHQNRKYRCVIGRLEAGSHVSNTPSARTS